MEKFKNQLLKEKDSHYYLCEFCDEIKQIQNIPKTFGLLVNTVSNIYQLNINDVNNLIWTFEEFEIENDINNDKCISFKDEGIFLNQSNFHKLFEKKFVIIHLKVKDAENNLNVEYQNEWNEEKISQQAKSRIIDKIKQNINKQQDEKEQNAKLASSIMIDNLNNTIKHSFLKTKLEFLREIYNYLKSHNNKKAIDTNLKKHLITYKEICSGCQYPIEGEMYKCVYCNDYILCDNCEEIMWKIHKHPFYKVKYPIEIDSNLNK